MTVRRSSRRVCHTVRVLPACRFGREESAERLSVRLRRVFPVGPDQCPAFAETFFVGVTVLRDDRRDPLGMANGHSKARRRAIVENVERETVESDNLGKTLDHASYVVACEFEILSRRHIALTEPW